MATPQRVRETNIAADVAQFLMSVRPEDLITELVQNELDAGSQGTLIEFRDDSIVCTGSGRPVDKEGWQRLRLVKAVGFDLEKRDGIGVKNHGLRVGFHWGDEIIVQSDHRETRLFVRGNNPKCQFDPAAWEHPIWQPNAPSIGCRISIPLRTRNLRAPGRDGFLLTRRLPSQIDELFDRAVAEAPSRFIGVVCPGLCHRYELVLNHSRGDTYQFVFTSAPIPAWKGRQLFRRSCRLSVNHGEPQIVLREEAHTFPIQLGGFQRSNVPKFYRAQRGVLAEISWQLNERGLPCARLGKLRYPIEYPDQAAHADTGLGLNFSAPFSSDQQRHGTAEGVERNDSLKRLCETRLSWLLRHRLIPQFGPEVLELLRKPDSLPSDATERVLLQAAAKGALPAATILGAKRKKTRRTLHYKCVPSATTSRNNYNFLVSCLSWRADRIDPILAQLCPPRFSQLHPRTPRFATKILTAQIYYEKSPSVPYFIFDQTDAIARLQPESGTGDFPWSPEEEWTRELGNAQRVSLYLDVVRKSLDSAGLDDESIEALQNNGVLPNDRGAPTPWSELFWSRWPVPKIPGLEADIIHPSLAAHKALARRSPLALSDFDIDEALSGIDWSNQDNAVRRRFFDWLRQTQLRLDNSTWQDIGDYPIWPGPDNSSVSFDAYCEPTNRAAIRILANHILRPPRTVLGISKVSKTGRGVLGLRVLPTEQEIQSWCNHHAPHQQDRTLRKFERTSLDRLEQNISTLRRDNKIRRSTSCLTAQHRTIDGNGRLKRVADLHIATEAVKGCRLLPEDLVGGRHRRLYQALGARTKPSSDALERALRRDARTRKLFYRRIEAFVRACDDPERIAGTPCIRRPKQKRLYGPRELALPFNQDYWGSWKKKYPFSDLDPGKEHNLIAIGMIDRTPTRETSQAFFKWLSEQREAVLRQHLPQVIRHFQHKYGPFAWWKHYRWLPCLPVQMKGHRLKLVPFGVAAGKPARIYIPDFYEIVEQVLNWDDIRCVAVVEHPRVSGSILNDLKREGVHSLRSECSPPVHVNHSGNESRARHLEEKLRKLTKRPLRNELPKRLEEQDISGRTLKKGWTRALERVTEVCVADEITPIFKLGYNHYAVERPWAVSADGSTIWIMDSDNQSMFLYEAIATLIFEEGTPPNKVAYPLHNAVSMDYRSRFTSDKARNSPRIDHLEEAEMEASTGDDTGKEPTPTENPSTGKRRVHGAETKIPVPSPRKLPRRNQSEYELEPPSTHTKKRTQDGAKVSRRESPQENEEKLTLKENHYAYHCQACLGNHDVSEIAPQPTYGFHVRNRKPIIEAHHADHLGKGGPRGAANLIVLCEYHHQLLGDRMTRNQIGAKLRDEAVKAVRRFPVDPEGENAKAVSGRLITVDLDVEPYSIKLFFTGAHAELWRT